MTTAVTTTVSPEAPQNAGRPSGRKAAGPTVKLNLSGEPSVQLLPPSIRDRDRVRSRIRTGVLLVILGVVVAGGLFAVGTLRTTQAGLALQAANDRTTELLAQQAQYAEAVKVDALVQQIEELQIGATSTEIDWAALVRQLLVKLPAGGEVLTVTGASVPPWEQMPTIGETEAPQIATLLIELSTLTIQDATSYSRSLSELDGFVASTVSQVAVGTDGRVTTKLTLTLTTGAESHRFVDAEDEESTEESDDGSSEGTEG